MSLSQSLKIVKVDRKIGLSKLLHHCDMPSDVLLQHDVNEIQTFIHFAATMNKMYLKIYG